MSRPWRPRPLRHLRDGQGGQHGCQHRRQTVGERRRVEASVAQPGKTKKMRLTTTTAGASGAARASRQL
eukprot:4304491-Prorocentrum_lima.AAC.1